MVPETKPTGLGADDPLYAKAVDFVRESGKASISALQRALKLGYNRSAWLIEAMAEAGVISHADKSGSRHVIKHGPRNDKAPGNVRRRKASSAPS
ncbi:DNA translocase FtsK [Dyella sp.]|uniref:DNA translocase FtsK n=1 Tax=Dyella sp. TaxID=1869338 RepID=UPI002FDA298C